MPGNAFIVTVEIMNISAKPKNQRKKKKPLLCIKILIVDVYNM